MVLIGRQICCIPTLHYLLSIEEWKSDFIRVIDLLESGPAAWSWLHAKACVLFLDVFINYLPLWERVRTKEGTGGWIGTDNSARERERERKCASRSGISLLVQIDIVPSAAC
jgi:hypothetical protein